MLLLHVYPCFGVAASFARSAASFAFRNLERPQLRCFLVRFTDAFLDNGARKTNAAFGVACFSFAPII